MNETTGNNPPGTDFAAMGQDFWSTRPRRPRAKEDGRRVAGVAAAIAARYDIDPVLVRVFFVITTFYGGAGLITYLAGWLLLPVEDDRVSPAEALAGRGRSSQSDLTTILLALLLIAVTITVFAGPGTATAFSLALSVGALVLLHHYRAGLGRVGPPSHPQHGPPPGHPGYGPPPGHGPAPNWTPGSSYGQPAHSTSTSTEPTGGSGPRSEEGTTMTNDPARPAAAAGTVEDVVGDTERITTTAPPPPGAQTPPPPSHWGAHPHGTPPPPPMSPPPPTMPGPPPGWSPPPKRPRTPVTAVTLACVLLAIAAMLMMSALGAEPNPQMVFGVILAVLGLGVLAGSILGGGRWLLVPTIPLAFVLMAVTAAPWNGDWRERVRDSGDRQWSVTNASTVRPEYRMGVGEGLLNLSNLRLSDQDTVRTRLRVDAGQARVLLPTNADVELTCSGNGEIRCLSNVLDRNGGEVTIVDNGPDGPGGGRIILNASVTIGTVEVTRG